MRKFMSEHLLIVGGVAMATGFLARLKSELLHLLETKYKKKLPIKGVKFFQLKGQAIENYAAWLGGWFWFIFIEL